MAKAKIFKEKQDIDTIIDGIIQNAEIVEKTFGYNGRDILVNQDGNSIITNDGVYVSNHIYFDNELKDLGSSLIRNITLNSDLNSGDGTTSSAIITKAIVTSLKKYLNNKKINTLELKNGMLEAQTLINDLFPHYKSKVKKEDYYDIAYTSTRNEEISKLISEVFAKIGSKGKVLFKESDAQGLSVEYQNGFTMNFGFNTNMLPNILEECSVILFKERINSVSIFQELVKKAIDNNFSSLLIIAKEGVADIVMQTALAIQQSKDINLNINIVNVSGTEKVINKLFKDLSVITSSKIIKNVSINEDDYIGYSNKVTITDNQTTFVDNRINKEEYKKHIKELEKSMIENRSEIDKEDIRKRIGNLQGLVAIIKIGALSREKINNYKDKIKDVVNSLRNAIDNGVVPGGGSVLNSIANVIENSNINKSNSFKIGFDIVVNSCKEPLTQILRNEQMNERKIRRILKEIKDTNCFECYGFNAKTKQIECMINSKILDPYSTILGSFNNAIEVSSMIPTLTCAIVSKSEVFENGR